MAPFWKSRKFWYMILDTVISCVLYFGAQNFGPQALEDIKFLIAALQPVIIVLIASVAYEDGQEKRSTGNTLMLTESDV